MNDVPRILIVDADTGHNARLVEQARPGVVEIITAAPADVERILSTTSIDGLVLDLDADEDVTATVVGEVERHTDGVPLVGITYRAEESKVASACHLGAAAILVKPFDIDTLMDLIRTPTADAGFSGSCGGVPTAQLLSLHCAAAHDGVLHLRVAATATRPERVGSVFFEAGQPVHALAGTAIGAEAVHAILGWRDAEATWVHGVTRSARTIVGRWEGLFATGVRSTTNAADLDRTVALAHPEVVEKLARLAQTPDVLGAFLLRHAEIVTGRCVPGLDEQLASRALCRLAHVFFDVEAQPQSAADGEIQAVIGDLRLVLDRIGPREAGFQVGVVVRQAAPVCKSLRRLLRQIDSSFERVAPPRQSVRTPTTDVSSQTRVAAVA